MNQLFINNLSVQMQIFAILIAVLFLGIVSYFFLKKSISSNKKPSPSADFPVSEGKKIVDSPLEKIIEKTWHDRLSFGLLKSRQQIWGKISQILKGKNLNDEMVESLESLLYQADLPSTMVQKIISNLKVATIENLNLSLKEQLLSFIKPATDAALSTDLFNLFWTGEKDSLLSKKLIVIMVVGVNGAGKTTSIGKMAHKFSAMGYKVFVGAADTFRAAAVEQLQIWCERSNVTCVTGKPGQEPASVVYETVLQAQKAEAQICILDTAGRLHNNVNLMDELTKMKKVIQKLDPSFPQEVLLVLDAMMGQNVLKQAKQFHQALHLTGLILTKCDGSAKAGAALGIMNELLVPVKLVGVGETVEDLNLFHAEEYVDALIGEASPAIVDVGQELT